MRSKQWKGVMPAFQVLHCIRAAPNPEQFGPYGAADDDWRSRRRKAKSINSKLDEALRMWASNQMLRARHTNVITSRRRGNECQQANAHWSHSHYCSSDMGNWEIIESILEPIFPLPLTGTHEVVQKGAALAAYCTTDSRSQISLRCW